MLFVWGALLAAQGGCRGWCPWVGPPRLEFLGELQGNLVASLPNGISEAHPFWIRPVASGHREAISEVLGLWRVAAMVVCGERKALPTLADRPWWLSWLSPVLPTSLLAP